MKKINIIQFLPFFPPHKLGDETLGEEVAIHWERNNLGEVIQVITSLDQSEELHHNEQILFQGEIIGYKKNNIIHLVVPSREFISHFPIYIFFNKKTRLVFQYLKQYTQEHQDVRIITHFRFSATSLLGARFARWYNMPWIHIEHGIDFVKFSNTFKTNLSILYDKVFGKWIVKNATITLATSEASKKFINREFLRTNVEIFYRGIDFPHTPPQSKSGDIKIVYIGKLVALKGVINLLEAYKQGAIDNELIIIGDGPERGNLEKVVDGKNIRFLGFKDKEFIIDFLSKNNCLLVNPSYIEGMPTVVIESLLTKNVVVASDVGGTNEITSNNDLILFNPNDTDDLSKKISFALENYDMFREMSYEEVVNRFTWDKSILQLYKYLK